MLGVEYPIIAFSHCRDVIVSVVNAGGFGVLGATGFTPENLDVDLSLDRRAHARRSVRRGLALSDEAGGRARGQRRPHPVPGRAVPREAHRQFVDDMLDRYGVPPLPEDSAEALEMRRERGTVWPPATMKPSGTWPSTAITSNWSPARWDPPARPGQAGP